MSTIGITTVSKIATVEYSCNLEKREELLITRDIYQKC